MEIQPSPEASRLEMNNLIKRSSKEMMGFRGVAQIRKSSPGCAKAGNAQFIKRNNKKIMDFGGVVQIRKFMR